MADDLEDEQWLYGDSSEKLGENVDAPSGEPEASEEQDNSTTQIQTTVIFKKKSVT